jgi:hypothetical protein
MNSTHSTVAERQEFHTSNLPIKPSKQPLQDNGLVVTFDTAGDGAQGAQYHATAKPPY